MGLLHFTSVCHRCDLNTNFVHQILYIYKAKYIAADESS